MPHPAPKAIETHYRGCRFRSRLEARWAVFLDALGVRWVYEREGYDLGPAGWYLPDFWLPELNWWLEVKPEPPSPDERAKMLALAQATRRAVCCFCDCLPPWQSEDLENERDFGWAFTPDGETGKAWWIHLGRAAVVTGLEDEPASLTDLAHGPELSAAFSAALGARFEHGDRDKMAQISTQYRRSE
jgi:hypothetical protein